MKFTIFLKYINGRFAGKRNSEMRRNKKSFILISLLSRSDNMSSDSAMGDNSSLGCGHER